jgi:glyoxylase-like metal-dependent hydrolase (beta-lactamase superfamily II)
VVGAWPDTFKGATHPIGAEADRVKRISGVRRAAAELTFSEEMLVHLGEREVILWHRPGPTAGSIWLVLDDAKVVFIGDAVTVHEPPYLGDAELEAWFDVLDELRRPRWKSYTIVSSRDGVIDPAAITPMARYLRKVETRLRRLARSGDGEDGVGDIVRPLMKDFRLSASRREQVQLRLEAGLSRLYSRRYHGSA